MNMSSWYLPPSQHPNSLNEPGSSRINSPWQKQHCSTITGRLTDPTLPKWKEEKEIMLLLVAEILSQMVELLSCFFDIRQWLIIWQTRPRRVPIRVVPVQRRRFKPPGMLYPFSFHVFYRNSGHLLHRPLDFSCQSVTGGASLLDRNISCTADEVRRALFADSPLST